MHTMDERADPRPRRRRQSSLQPAEQRYLARSEDRNGPQRWEGEKQGRGRHFDSLDPPRTSSTHGLSITSIVKFMFLLFLAMGFYAFGASRSHQHVSTTTRSLQTGFNEVMKLEEQALTELVNQIGCSWSSPWAIDHSADIMDLVAIKYAQMSSSLSTREVDPLFDDYTVKATSISMDLSEFQQVVLASVGLVHGSMQYTQDTLQRLKSPDAFERMWQAVAASLDPFVEISPQDLNFYVKQALLQQIEETLAELESRVEEGKKLNIEVGDLKNIIREVRQWASAEVRLTEKGQKELQKGIQHIWSRLGFNKAELQTLKSDKQILEYIWGDINTVHTLVNQTTNTLKDTVSELSVLKMRLQQPVKTDRALQISDIDRIREDMDRVGSRLGGLVRITKEESSRKDSQVYKGIPWSKISTQPTSLPEAEQR